MLGSRSLEEAQLGPGGGQLFLVTCPVSGPPPSSTGSPPAPTQQRDRHPSGRLQAITGTLGSCSGHLGACPRPSPELPSLGVLLALRQKHRFLSREEGEGTPALQELSHLAASCGRDGAVTTVADTRGRAKWRLSSPSRRDSQSRSASWPPPHPQHVLLGRTLGVQRPDRSVCVFCVLCGRQVA